MLQKPSLRLAEAGSRGLRNEAAITAWKGEGSRAVVVVVGQLQQVAWKTWPRGWTKRAAVSIRYSLQAEQPSAGLPQPERKTRRWIRSFRASKARLILPSGASAAGNSKLEPHSLWKILGPQSSERGACCLHSVNGVGPGRWRICSCGGLLNAISLLPRTSAQRRRFLPGCRCSLPVDLVTPWAAMRCGVLTPANTASILQPRHRVLLSRSYYCRNQFPQTWLLREWVL